MYKRKGPIQRKIPKVQLQTENVPIADLDEINEPLNMQGITADSLSNFSSKKPVNMKVGDKVVKVQKFIISKDEMKQMAKLGKKVDVKFINMRFKHSFFLNRYFGGKKWASVDEVPRSTDIKCKN